MNVADILALLSPRRTTDGTWEMVADRALCLGPPAHKHMSGGACVAVMIAALETEFQRPVIQASAQFLRAPAKGASCLIEVQEVRQGRSISQVRAVLRTEKGESATLLATLGSIEAGEQASWARAPETADSEQCERIPFIREDSDDLHTHLDMRLASTPADHNEGRVMFWVSTDGMAHSQARLMAALIADYLPEAIHFCLGKPVGAVSLDNSLRCLGPAKLGWWLCETALSGVETGIAHGRMRIFDAERSLIAVGSQSAVVRPIAPSAR